MIGCFATQSVAQESNVAAVSGFLKIPQEEGRTAYIRADIILSVFVNPGSDGGASVEITTDEIVSQRIQISARAQPGHGEAAGGTTVNRRYSISFEAADAANEFVSDLLQKRELAAQRN